MTVSKPKISTENKITHYTKPWGRNSPKYIVFHFTGGCGKNSDTMKGMRSCYNLFMSDNTNAHYLVGKDAIWEW